MKFNMQSVKEVYSSKNIIKSYIDKQKMIGITEPEKRIILENISVESRILDLGCGTGRISLGLDEIGYENIVGIDVSEPMISNAIKARKEGSKIQFVNQDILGLTNELGSFDAVLAIHSITPLPHLEDRRKALKQIKRLLKANGTIIISAFLQETNTEYWEKEKSEWDKNNQDKRLIDFGDIILKKHKTEIFIHIPERIEFEHMIENTGLRITKRYDWTDLVDESQEEGVPNAQRCAYWVMAA